MKILSIDVGIKNLAFCLMQYDNNEYNILNWDIINISQSQSHKCVCLKKDKQECMSPVKYVKHDKYYCLKHSKKQSFQIPHNELSLKKLNNSKLQDLYTLANKYEITFDKPIKKKDLLTLFNEYTHSKCFEKVEEINSNTIDLIVIGRNIKIRLDDVFKDDINDIDLVIIENQIGPIANRMKTIQGMLTQYFIIKNENIRIEFISSSNKLKDFAECSHITKYNERKKFGIDKCLETLSNNDTLIEWVKFFKKHSKKDDLSDAFLQLLWYINNKISI